MLAREVVKWARAVHDAERVKAVYPGQVLDVLHTDFHRDPMGVVRHIYDFAGAQLTPETEAAMAVRISDKPELAHGVHRYDITDFGITVDDLRARFDDYVQRFDLVENAR